MSFPRSARCPLQEGWVFTRLSPQTSALLSMASLGDVGHPCIFSRSGWRGRVGRTRELLLEVPCSSRAVVWVCLGRNSCQRNVPLGDREASWRMATAAGLCVPCTLVWMPSGKQLVLWSSVSHVPCTGSAREGSRGPAPVSQIQSAELRDKKSVPGPRSSMIATPEFMALIQASSLKASEE